jgi:hypothetical protein
MKWVSAGRNSCRFVAALLMSSALCAQQAAAPAPAKQAAAQPPAQPAAEPAASPAGISSSLGVVVFPAKNQTPKQQSTDEGYCFGWAKTQTGIDPMAPAPQQSVSTSPATPTAGNGAPVRGAAGGAAAGAAVGAIAGDAGKGAAIGATTGVLAGAAAKRRAKQEAAQQDQQAQANATAQVQAAAAQQRATYNKAFTTCMEGKGYTAK